MAEQAMEKITPEMVMQDRELMEGMLSIEATHGMHGLMWSLNVQHDDLELAAAVMGAVQIVRGRRRTETDSRRSRRSMPPAS